MRCADIAGGGWQNTISRIIKNYSATRSDSGLSPWKAVPSKSTHYWLVRAVRKLGMSRQEAFMLEPYAAAVRQRDVLVVKAVKSRNGEPVIKIDTPDKQALVDELIQFVDDAGRKRLVWNRQQVPTLSQADRKLKSAVAYAVNQIRAANAGAKD